MGPIELSKGYSTLVQRKGCKLPSIRLGLEQICHGEFFSLVKERGAPICIDGELGGLLARSLILSADSLF